MVTLLACVSAPTPEAEVPEMSAVDLLERASLDLRGVRPTVAEIEAVEAVEALLFDMG